MFDRVLNKPIYALLSIIIFISSWYKIVKKTKNQLSSRYNYSFHATLRAKKIKT